MKNKILICGAGDFITGHLIRKLRQNNSLIINTNKNRSHSVLLVLKK